jgi:hypothetical protein
MSWSMSYTSKMGLVKDSYHRIPLIIDLSASSGVAVAKLESLERIVTDGMKHVFFRVGEEYSASGSTQILHNLEAYLERLQDANLVYNLYVTVYCANGEFIHDDTFLQRVCRRTDSPKTEIDVGCVVVSLLCEEVPDKEAENYHDVIKRFGIISGRIREFSSDIKIGISDCFNRKTLQHLFEAHPAQIAVAIPCEVDFPNFRCRNIEYIHSQGCNIFVLLSAELLPNLSREHVPSLEGILDKYDMAKGHIDTLLIKMLIQYGLLPCVDADLGLDYLRDHYAFMCDPFTYRTAQQAPTVVKRFVVQKAHVDELVVLSEEIECKEDEYFTRNYLHSLQPRTLTHENKILSRKLETSRMFDAGV